MELPQNSQKPYFNVWSLWYTQHSLMYVYFFIKYFVRWAKNSVRFENSYGNWLPDGPNSVRFDLTVWDMACMFCKCCRPWSYDIFWGMWSGSTLFAKVAFRGWVNELKLVNPWPNKYIKILLLYHNLKFSTLKIPILILGHCGADLFYIYVHNYSEYLILSPLNHNYLRTKDIQQFLCMHT